MSGTSVLILGAGINGAALARELAINAISVTLVDTADLSSGATSASSRLIHGGLRYLEYGEFDLVRESLEERTRLLHLAPDLVRPLELFVPIGTRFSGFGTAIRHFVRLPQRVKARASSRGLWLVRTGLRFYDLYARDPSLPRHRVYRADDPQAMVVDRSHFRWQCSYFDAQVQYPERMVVALLHDARRAAAESGAESKVHTHCRVRLHGRTAEVVDALGALKDTLQPSAVINATGAWVDGTLGQMGIASKRLIGGTKGSHFLTNHAPLRERLAGRGVYAEATDGRPVFILPLGEQVLVGTTEVPCEGDPRLARATQPELEYLLAAVNHVFGDFELTLDDVDWHYAGVRPLPYVDRGVPASITRRHWLHEHDDAPLPAFSVIGGKLTTCRSLAEEVTNKVLARLGAPVIANSRERPLSDREPMPRLDGMTLPLDYVRRVIEQEWVETLEDLVERRLMLLYHPRLTRRCLSQLAGLLSSAGKLAAADVEPAVEALIHRLRDQYGKRVG